MSEPEKSVDKENPSLSKSHATFPMPDEKGGGFEKHLEILKACVITSNQRETPSTLDQIKSTLHNKSNSTDTNISFLKKIGFLTGDKGQFQPTREAIDFFYASTSGNEVDAKASVRKIVENTWFWNSTRMYLQLKGAIPRTDLLAKIARDANVLPDKRKSSLSSLIEFLLYAGLVKEDAENISLNSTVPIKAANEAHNQIADRMEPLHPRIGDVNQKTSSSDVNDQVIRTTGKYVVNININLDSDTSEEHARKVIRAIIDELNK